MPTQSDAITERAIGAFVALYSRRSGASCEVRPWPGGNERIHDADALLLVPKAERTIRILLEATQCFQGPTERFGSRAERLTRNWDTLESSVDRVVPSDYSLTIYWRRDAVELVSRPARHGSKQRFVTSLLRTISEECAAVSRDEPARVIDDGLPAALQPYIRTIATAGGGGQGVRFRYPLQTNDGTIHYSEIPLVSTGVGPFDVSSSLANKLSTLSAYRQRARHHGADQVWLLVVAGGQSAASLFSPLSFIGKIPDAIPALKIKPTFDAIYLLAGGTWSRVEDPLGPPDEWLLVPLLQRGRKGGQGLAARK